MFWTFFLSPTLIENIETHKKGNRTDNSGNGNHSDSKITFVCSYIKFLLHKKRGKKGVEGD